MPDVSHDELHDAFIASDRPHILQITNHGIHQWDVIPGLPDTGGQNVFVNHLSDTLAQLGYRVTIVNRGGFDHPTTGEKRSGLHYRDASQRILYIEDGVNEFVRKEDMDEHTPALAAFLLQRLQAEGTPIDLIISHYWDGAKVGVLLNRSLAQRVPHVWVPHSLGAVKKLNMSPDTWDHLRIDERIAVEKELIKDLDGIAATSSRIRQSLADDYGYESHLFLPPCVDPERFHAHDLPADHDIWRFLADMTGLGPEEVRDSKIVTEISRTDTTKRKDVLINAFAEAYRQNPDALLVVAIDDTEAELAAALKALIRDLGIESRTAAVGNVWDRLPDLYAATAVYVSPSVMEGFGMAVQEAAATKVPVVSSDLVPFVTEYLLGDEVREVEFGGDTGRPMLEGEGAIVVPADDVPGFAKALETLLADDSRRAAMGDRAYDITIPHFTWRGMTERFLEAVGAIGR
ncbi:MAG: glycosyltransferase [Anaerolineae bacterium]|jgi:glycosyltransferase involved in cell wall biosynthesis